MEDPNARCQFLGMGQELDQVLTTSWAYSEALGLG